MKLIFSYEHRFTKIGTDYYTESQDFINVLQERYLKSFESVEIFARVNIVNDVPDLSTYFKIADKRISFIRSEERRVGKECRL